MERNAKRIPSLDGLRTISIVLVLFAHFLNSIGLSDSLYLGTLGVRVFFVISGFLITGLLLKEIDKSGKISLKRFYFRRTMRIFPPYYFLLVVLLILTLVGLFDGPISSFIPAFAYLTNYFAPVIWNLGHTWSLSTEEQFYLLFPGILLVLGTRRIKPLLIFVVLISPIIRLAQFYTFGTSHSFEKGFHTNMDALAWGCLLALYYTALHQNNYYQRFIKSTVVLILPFLIFAANLFADSPEFFAVACSFIYLSIALCVDWAVTSYETIPGRLLNSAPFTYIGMMSYSIYLWQQPFFNNTDSAWTKFPLNFVGTITMSLISYYMVEKSALNLRHRLERRFFDSSTEPQNVTP